MFMNVAAGMNLSDALTGPASISTTWSVNPGDFSSNTDHWPGVKTDNQCHTWMILYGLILKLPDLKTIKMCFNTFLHIFKRNCIKTGKYQNI